MARIGISYEQVAAAADALVAAGEQPTNMRVREKMGNTGSMGTVQTHMLAWRAARPVAAVAAFTLPPALAASLAQEFEKQVAAARSELETSLDVARTEARQLGEEGDALEAQCEALKDRVEGLEGQWAMAKQESASRASEITRLEFDVKREREALQAAAVDVASARVRADALAEEVVKLNAEIERLKASNVLAQQVAQEAQEQFAKAREAAAVANAKREAAEEKAAASVERERLAQARISDLVEDARELAKLHHAASVAEVEVLKKKAAAPAHAPAGAPAAAPGHGKKSAA